MSEIKHQLKRNQERYNPLSEYGKLSEEDIKKVMCELQQIKRAEKNKKELIGCSIFFVGIIILFIILCIIF